MAEQFNPPPPWLQKMWDMFGVLPGQGRSFYEASPQSPNQRVQTAFNSLPADAGGGRIDQMIRALQDVPTGPTE